MRDLFNSRSLALLALSCTLAAGCTDQQRVTGPGDGQPSPAVAAVRCRADVAARSLTCEAPTPAGQAGRPSLIVGGQNVFITLIDNNVAYNAMTEIFSADVQVWNSGIVQQLGTPDGIQVTGIKVFFHSGPSVTSGTGTVTVSNADGTGTFTGSNQPYHFYNTLLPPSFVSGTKNWQWSVSPTVNTFEFSVFVQADVPGESGFVRITPSTDFLTPAEMITLDAEVLDVLGRPSTGSVTFSSSDAAVVTVHPSTGLVTAVGGGRAVITASTGGPHAPGKAVITVDQAGYQIELLFLTSLTPTQQAAFESARARWEAIVTGDLTPIGINSALLPACGGGPVDEGVDDLVINVIVGPIDGVGGILGQAGPCVLRTPGFLPLYGIMIFDSEDLADLESNNQLEDVILHEMGHVVGIGSIWEALGLVLDDGAVAPDCDTPALADPYFTGALALAAFNAAGGMGYTGNKVPVEDLGGPGTRCGHWRESVFQTELMTGFISAPGTANPLSAISLQSMADMGYTVDVGEADAYTLPSPPGLAGLAAGQNRSLGDDIWRGAVYRINAQGHMIQVLPDRRPELVRRLDTYRAP